MFQWWLKLLHHRKQAAELRLVHPLRPPPKPDPRSTLKNNAILHKEFRLRCILASHLLATIFFFAISSERLIRCSVALWLPLLSILIIDWSCMFSNQIGKLLNSIANQPSKTSTIIRPERNMQLSTTSSTEGDLLELASLVLLLDAINTAETMFLSVLNFSISASTQCVIFLCTSINQHIAQCASQSITMTSIIILDSAFRFIRNSLILWCRMPKFKSIFTHLSQIPSKIRLFAFVDLPSLCLETIRPEPQSICDFQAEFDELLEESNRWTWQDLVTWEDTAHVARFLEGPSHPDCDFKYSVDYNSPVGLPIPAFSSPAGGGLNYKLRRHIKRQGEKLETKLECNVTRQLVSCQEAIPRILDSKPSPITDFIGTFNPASSGMSLLRIERFHGRHAPKSGSKRVSVNINSCLRSMCKYIASNVCTFPIYEEFVHNAFQNSNLPLIVDTGASCCVTPRRDDFISGTYRPSNVKIKDLSGANKVAGRGMIRWTVCDASGKAFDIEIEGYHVPQASVRLLSPQCLYTKFGPKSLGKTLQGYGYQDDSKYVINLPKFDLVLKAPYGLANLPILPMNPSASPAARWNEVFLVSESDRNCWNQSQLDAKNQNLTLAQQELLTSTTYADNENRS